MKNLTTFIIVLLGISVMGCSKGSNNEINESSEVTLQDLAGISIIVFYPEGFLTSYVFYSQNNVIYATHNNIASSNGALPCVMKSKNLVAFEGGDGEVNVYLSKDANGKLILDKFLDENNAPLSITVLFNTADALSFVGKTYKENDASYIGFSTDKWGWSNTPNVQYTTSYGRPLPNFVFWKSYSASGLDYFGVNIPAGVQWDGQAGPLMLVDRTGFTKPSIYKPF